MRSPYREPWKEDRKAVLAQQPFPGLLRLLWRLLFGHSNTCRRRPLIEWYEADTDTEWSQNRRAVRGYKRCGNRSDPRCPARLCGDCCKESCGAACRDLQA